MNGFNINEMRNDKETYCLLMYKVRVQSKEILEKKKEDWKARKEISR